MRVQELFESMKSFVDTKSELTSAEVFKKLSTLLKKYEKAAKKLETANTSSPSAPDTSKFTAHKSGAVSLEKNVTVHGAYNSSVTYDEFLKIGGAISLDKRRAAVDDKFLADVKKFADDVASENTHIKCSDYTGSGGGQVSIRIAHGTNWGGIGIRLTKK